MPPTPAAFETPPLPAVRATAALPAVLGRPSAVVPLAPAPARAISGRLVATSPTPGGPASGVDFITGGGAEPSGAADMTGALALGAWHRR